MLHGNRWVKREVKVTTWFIGGLETGPKGPYTPLAAIAWEESSITINSPMLQKIDLRNWYLLKLEVHYIFATNLRTFVAHSRFQFLKMKTGKV